MAKNRSLIPGRSRRIMKAAPLLFPFIMLLCACGTEQTSPPLETSVTLNPASVDVHAGQTVQFTATVHHSTNTTVNWGLSGDGCSGATCGTISDAGLYTAPAGIPSPPTVTVKATAAADTSKSASAIVTIVAPYGYLNDLWRHDGINWTWVAVNQPGRYGTMGIGDPLNCPGARRYAAFWTDGAAISGSSADWGIPDRSGHGPLARRSGRVVDIRGSS